MQKHPRLGIEVLSGCNLRDITDRQIEEFKQLLWKHGVVVIKNQNLTATQLVNFAKKTFEDSVAGEKIWEYDPTINRDLHYKVQARSYWEIHKVQYQQKKLGSGEVGNGIKTRTTCPKPKDLT